MNKKNIEFWVGLFIFTGMITFATMVIRFGSYDKLRDTYPLTAAFNYTEGVVVGAPVRVSGVDAGRVKNLVLTPDKETKVGILMDIDKKVTLRKNALVTINSLGIMGEKYVEFLPQTPDAAILKPGDWIVGKDPISIAAVTASINDVITQVKGVFGDQKAGNKLGQIMDNLVQLTGPPNRDNVQASLANLRQFSDRMNTFSGDLETLSKEKKFTDTVNNFRDASASLKAILSKIESGQGTIGQLIYKSDFYDKMKRILENPSIILHPAKDKDKGKGSSLFKKSE